MKTIHKDIVRATRLANGHTAQEAAYLIDGSYRTWQAWENGQRNMPAIKFEKYLQMAALQPGIKSKAI